VGDIPDLLVLKRHRDLEGMYRSSIWFRRVVIGLITAAAALGLANVFGQRPETVRAVTPVATLSLYAPTALRGGDFMEARFHITASRELKNAILKLDPGWAEGLSINTIEPSPLSEGSDDGRLTFQLGHIPAGRSYILFCQFQVNPTNVAWRRSPDVELDDGATVLTRIHRTITIFP
jgi:hypothetical protein